MSNVRKLYAVRFFQSLIPAYVIERLFWEERGMTVPEVVYTEIIFAAAIVLFEVPTGIIADRWGRKRMLLVSAFMGVCEFAILVYATEFWHFALVVFLAAIGHSASSGAGDALLYDSLASAGQAPSFEKHAGRLNAADIVATVLAALAGSLLASRFDFEFNYWISLISMIVCTVFTFSLSEPAMRRPADDDERPLPIRAYWTASIRFFRQRPDVSLVVLAGIATGAAVNFVDEFWQTYADRLGVPVLYFGLLSAAIYLLRLPGNVLAYALIGRFRYRSLLPFIAAVMTAGFLYMLLVRDYSGLLAVCVISLAAGAIGPLAAGYLHHRVDSAMRATIGSFQSLGENAALSLVGVGFGYWAARAEIFGGFGFVGVVCGAFFVYLVRVRGKLE